MKRPFSYRDAGVDISAGDEAVEKIKAHVRSTFRPEVIGDVGGFGGLFRLDARRHADPVLVSSTDGVGTKSLIAQAMRRYDTIGIDLVAMSVDDVAVQGAEPLFFLDYIAVGKLDPVMIDAIVSGVAHGCRQAGCALIGGEMSEHPGLLEPGQFDLVGFAVGAAAQASLLPRGARAGDRIVGMASPGMRSNGYSLARKVLLEVQGRRLEDAAWKGAHHSLGDELLAPSVVYAPAMAELRRHVDVHAFAHVTGGGIPGNLARVLTDRCDAVVRRGTWTEPRIFDEIQRAGDVEPDEMARVFNLGVGMLAVVAQAEARRAIDVVRRSGHDAWEIGQLVDGRGKVVIERA